MPIKHPRPYATRAYQSYMQSHYRCTDPENRVSDYYLGRVKWRLPPFAVFFAIMGERPKGYVLDRIDPYGDYEMTNVRWAPRGQGRQTKHRK